MSWIDRLLGRPEGKAEAEQRDSTYVPTPEELKAAYEVISTWRVNKPQYPQANFETNVRDGFRKNELIFACIALKADSAAQATLRVHRKSDGKEIEEHPLRRLILNPSARLRMTEFDFHAANFAYQDLAGIAHWEKVRARNGEVRELLPLRPDWMHPIPSAQNFVAGYEYRVPGEQPERIAAEDVLSLKINDPLDQYRGLAPVSVLARTGDVDNEATDHIKNVLENGGMPMGLLSSKNNLTDAKITAIRTRWRERYSGYKNWVEPAVLDADATFQKLGFSFEELGFEVLDARNEARICMVLRVPPILVGAKIGLDRSTYSNYAEARTAFWQETLVPQYKRVRDAMQQSLADEYGDIELRWDFSDVVALQEDQGALRAWAVSALASGGITINEFREYVDKPLLPEGDLLLVPSTVQAVPVTVEGRPKPQLPAELEKPDPAAAAPQDPNADPNAQDTSTAEAGKKLLPIVPLGSGNQLPALTDVWISESDLNRAEALWDSALPEFAGLLSASVNPAEDQPDATVATS